MSMKTKEILLDDIITEYNGELFKHGEVKYEILDRDDIPGLTKTQVDFGMVIRKEDSDNFIKALTELVKKYSI